MASKSELDKTSAQLFQVLQTRAMARHIQDVVNNGDIADLFPEYKHEHAKVDRNTRIWQGIIPLALALCVTFAVVIGASGAPSTLTLSEVMFFALAASLPMYAMVVFLTLSAWDRSQRMPLMNVLSLILAFGVTGCLLIGLGLSFF